MMRRTNLYVVLIIGLVLLFVLTWFLYDQFFPSYEPGNINDKICVHYEPNHGSAMLYEIYTYECENEINWEARWKPFLYDNYNFNDEFIDMVSTIECPRIRFKTENQLVITQKKLCKFFAHDYHEPEYLLLEIDSDGNISIIEEK